MNTRRTWLLTALGFAVLVIGLFHAVLFPPTGHILFGDDYLKLLYYQRIFFQWSLSHVTLPFWNPYLYSGIPILEHPQTAFWYPLNLLFLLLPTPTAYPVDLSVHLFIAMTTMYYFMRRWVGRLPAIVSGVAYGMSTFFWYRIPAGHSNVIAAAAWAPLVFALFWRIWEIPKRFEIKRDMPIIIVAGMAFALQLLSGYKTIGILTAEAIGIACCIICINQRSIRPILYSLIAGIIGLLLDAVELAGNQQYVLKSIFSLHLPYRWAMIGTPTLQHLWEIIDPVAYGLNHPTDLYLIHERAAYIGGVALALAAIALAATLFQKKYRSVSLTFFIISFLGIWIGFGSQMPFDLFALIKKLPLYNSIRVPPRHFFWFVLGGSALAGFGAEMFRKKIIQLALLGVLLWQLIPIAQSQLYLVNLPDTSIDPTLVSYLQQHEGQYRFLETGNQQILSSNAPVEYHLNSLFGYLPPPILSYMEYILAVNHIPLSSIADYVDTIPPFQNVDSPYTDALGVKYIVTSEADDTLASDTNGKFTKVKENPSGGWRIYDNRDAFPRFYFVPRVEILPTRADVTTAIDTQQVNPKETVFIAKTDLVEHIPSGDCQESSIGSVNLTDYSPTLIRLTTNSLCAAYLMSSEIYYPGWQASIDGKKESIWEGNLAFRMIFVPKGTHTIVYRFIPVVLYIGLLVSLTTLAGCAGVLWKIFRPAAKKK